MIRIWIVGWASSHHNFAHWTSCQAHDGHMTRAADSLGIPQSSMSRRIHALEKPLGLRLVIQDGRTVRLTPTAVRLADRAEIRYIALPEAAVEAIAGEADAHHGTVRFGFPLTMGSGRLPTLIAEFHRRAPGIRLQIKQAHGSQPTTDPKSGELDVAVMIPATDEVRHTVIGAQPILRDATGASAVSPDVSGCASTNCATNTSSRTR